MKYNNKTMSVAEFTELKQKGKIKLDPSFQVGTDKVSRWEKKQQSKYIRSILFGSAPSPFILVDINAALEYNEGIGIDDDSIEYFKQLKDEGYLYVSVDGNNRSIALRNFADNEIIVPSGDYETSKGIVSVKPGKNKNKSLNKLLLDKFNNSELSFAIYTEIQKINLPVLFRNVNDGVPLNGQQIRQSYPSKIAQYVRDKRNTFEKSLKNFVKNKEFIVLKADEFIAKCIAYAAYNTTDKKTLDKVYMSPLGEANKIVRPGKTDSKFNRVLNTVLDTIKVGTANLKKSSNSIFDYFCISYDYKMQNVKIDKPAAFYDLWLETTGKMFADEKTTYDSPKQGDTEKYNFKTLTRKIGDEFRVYRQKLVKDKIEDKAFTDKILVQQEDPDDYFSYDDKVKMWERQKGKCTRTKKEIPFNEIADSTKWHGDAVIPKDKGGTHTLDNGELIDATFNIKKSNKLI